MISLDLLAHCMIQRTREQALDDLWESAHHEWAQSNPEDRLFDLEVIKDAILALAEEFGCDVPEGIQELEDDEES